MVTIRAMGQTFRVRNEPAPLSRGDDRVTVAMATNSTNNNEPLTVIAEEESAHASTCTEDLLSPFGILNLVSTSIRQSIAKDDSPDDDTLVSGATSLCPSELASPLQDWSPSSNLWSATPASTGGKSDAFSDPRH